MMDNLRPPPASKAHGHVRVTSEDRRRMSAVRKSTIDPLVNADDPLSASSGASPGSPQVNDTSQRLSAQPSPLLSPTSDVPEKDFSFLLQPQNFQTLPPRLLEPLDAEAQLSDLLRAGRYHDAAAQAAQEITDLPVGSDAMTIFRLWYIRLSCLCLIQQTTIAAQESKILGDMTSSFYKSHTTREHLVPWDLRVLAVRLQALGFGEPKRGLMAYYVLAHEARLEAASALERKDEAMVELWRARLIDLGIRVASALVEMGDNQSAATHLKTLDYSEKHESQRSLLLICQQVLSWIMVGDLDQAAKCLSQLSQTSGYIDEVMQALLSTCHGDYAASTSKWQSLNRDFPNDPLIQQNLAVCQLYTCEMITSKNSISDMLKPGPQTVAYPSLLFNMASLYELSSENASLLKRQLAERLSTAEHGLERAAAEFKL